MSIFVGQLIQGQGQTLTLTASTATFQGTETLTGTLSTGGTAAATLTLTPTWTAGQTTGAYSEIDVAFTSVQTAALTPGYYVLQAGIADASAVLAWGLVEVVAAAGQLPAYDWLVQPAEVLGLIPDLVTVDNLADLPRILTASTDLIRRYCRRNFTRSTWTKEFRPSYQGIIRLDEIPVNQVTRVAIGRDNAMRIAGPSSAQIARVQFAYTGDYAAGIVNTGVTLTSMASAVTTTTTLDFATYPTLADLGGAIQGAGWTCEVTSGYSAWPCSELVGGDAAQGALTGDGAWLDVYSEDATLERLDPETGMIWLRNRYGSTDWNNPAWGPDRGLFTDARPFPVRAKVSYDAGFATLPSAVVQAAVELVQASFARLRADNAVKSERAGDYSYTYRDRMDAMPLAVQQLLAPYRIFNA